MEKSSPIAPPIVLRGAAMIGGAVGGYINRENA
jgi:hypothetical protein